MPENIPDSETLADLTRHARALVARRERQMGYPFDQGTDLAAFYRWMIDTGLCDTTLINVASPYKTAWDMLDTDKYERAVLDFLADLYGFDAHWGVISNGGTDGNMHGLYFGRKALLAQTGLEPILYASKEAHYSLYKLGDVLNIETRLIEAHPMGQMDADDLARKLDPKRPVLLALAAGGTFKGAIDDAAQIDAALAKKSPLAVYRHVDAALFGGYLPFLDDARAQALLNARKNHFDSIAVSGHKFFGLNEPAGIFLCRKDVFDQVHSVNVPYLNGEVPTIACSRSGFDALKLYWRMKTVGTNGWRHRAEHSLEMTGLLCAALEKRRVPHWVNPLSNTVFFREPKAEIVHTYCMARAQCPHLGKLAHVVVMPYFTPQIVEKLADDIAS